MKKLISLSAIISLVASACTTSVIDAPDEKSQAIAFGGPQAESRAAIEAGDFPTTSTFKVWGGYGDTETSVNANNLFDGVEIIYTEESRWHYEGYPRFWVGGKPHDFYAIYPMKVKSDVSEQGIITVTDFDSSQTGNEAIDLMTAFHSRVTSEELNQNDVAAVSLKFEHELSRVNIKVKGGNTKVTVNNLKIYGISNVGTLTKEEKSLWAMKEQITTDNTPFAITVPFELNETDGWEKNVLGDMLLIPQNLENAKLDISYKYDGANTDMTSAINLKTAVISEWEAGMSYNYSITINGFSDINIVVLVSPWEEENTSVSWE